MLDNLKAMQAVAGLMKNKDKLKEAGERIKSKTDALRVTGQAGGGACRATVNGRMKLLDLTLDPALLAGMSVDEKTRELATGLIRDAVNDAQEKAQEQVKEIIAREAEALGIPGLSDQLSGLIGA
jgi:DNA-binding protein YbaB